MRYFIFILTLTFQIALHAQEPTEKELKKHAEKVAKSKEKSKNLVSLDTLFASGKPYCIMKGLKKFLGAYGAFSIRPLGNPESEEIYIESEREGTGSTSVLYWNMVFVNHGQKIRFKSGDLDIENSIVEYDLFSETGLNVAGMNKLVLLKGGATSTQPSTVKNDKLVDRNRNGMVQVFGASIKQSGVLIGTIKKEDKAEAGEVITYYTISLPNGELIATAKNTGIADYNWQIVVAKDNTSHTVSSSIGNSEADIAKYLVEHLYL